MANILIRLDERSKDRLRRRAASNKRSMEDEAREILRSALSRGDAAQRINLAQAIGSRFKPLGGVDLELPPRGAIREPMKERH